MRRSINTMMQISRRRFLETAFSAAILMGAGAGVSCAPNSDQALRQAQPNILWLVAEDMSPHMGCYGETTIATPKIDRLAAQGAKFNQAFVTAPVCSPSRSAMITGMYQTSIGAHNHRSSRGDVKIHLPPHVKTIPEYFKEAGYYTVLGDLGTDPYFRRARFSKADYNFVWDDGIYDGDDWSGRKPGQPFFAKINLIGGKGRSAKVPEPVDPAKVKLPPYYPDHPVLRKEWANYLNSVINLDIQMGQILKRLEDEEIADNTVVFFFTDHGMAHIRHKNFLYEGGIWVPLIIRWPGVIEPGTVRDDLVSHIDVGATSLYMAGIEVPDYMEGQPLFGPDYRPRDYIVAARDRCDATVDRIRCVRNQRFKYIRNFYPDRSHTQPKYDVDRSQVMITMRQLHAEGKLNANQSRVFLPTRPVEELYDLQTDPHELNNLAELPNHQDTLKHMRSILEDWIETTGDKGQVPESRESLEAAEAAGRAWRR